MKSPPTANYLQWQEEQRITNTGLRQERRERLLRFVFVAGLIAVTVAVATVAAHMRAGLAW